MDPFFAEYLTHQFRSAVDNERMLLKVWRGVHQSLQPDDLLDPIEIADCGSQGRQNIQPDKTRMCPCVLYRDIKTYLATLQATVSMNWALP
jgi:hypothetical protein